MDFTGQTVIVTGAASGIGAATAQQFATAGANVTCLDLNQAGLESMVGKLTSAGLLATGIPVDVADQAAVHDVVNSVGERHGRIDAVVNCAASFLNRSLDVTREDWDHVMRVNVGGISNTVQAAHPHLKKSPHPAIVNTASISAHIAQPGRWTYNATKGAIVSLTRCQAMDLSGDGIRVNSVSPGWIWTPEVAQAAEGDREKWEPIWGQFHLLRRLGDPIEVAKVNLFLCSTDSSFITGADLPVDGGYLAMGPEGLGQGSSFAGSA